MKPTTQDRLRRLSKHPQLAARERTELVHAAALIDRLEVALLESGAKQKHAEHELIYAQVDLSVLRQRMQEALEVCG